MFSALWLAPLAFLLSAGMDDPKSGPLDLVYFGLTLAFWLGHRVGSTWLAYFTTAYRPLVKAEPVRFVVVPLAIAALCFAILLPADGTLPWTRAQRLMGLVILDYLLVTYHFASQHFGALSLYRLRAGNGRSKRARGWDRLYALVIGGLLVVAAEVVAGTVFYIDVWVDPWLDPDGVASAAGIIRVAGTAIVAAATLAMLAVEVRSPSPSLPRAVYLLGLAAMVVVAFHVQSPFLFIVVWSAQHWIVATGLTTLVARAEPAPERSGWREALHAVNRRPWALLLVLGAISVLLLPLMEIEAVDDDRATYAQRIFGDLATALRTSAWVPALLAFGMTTAFLHYWLDRAVYRFSDARVREAARGLLAAPPRPTVPAPRAAERLVDAFS
jgi:hypothetical protein